MVSNFEERLKEAKNFLEGLPQPILLVGHLDTDGLSTTAIMQRILDSLNISYETKILPQLSSLFIKSLENFPSYIFMDGGSGLLDTLPTPALVIDHHQLPTTKAEGVFVLNPMLDGHDGSQEVCSATIAWMLAKEYDLQVAWLAVLGLTGDAQDKQGITGLNALARDAALKEGVRVCRAPRLFGVFSKPLAKVLAKSGDLRIQGITNNYKGTLIFLKNLNINSKKPYASLNSQEQELLLRALQKQKKITCIDHFGFDFPGPLADARQFATFLNACGRLQKPEVGLAFLAGEHPCDPQEILNEYAFSLRKATEWAQQEAKNFKELCSGLFFCVLQAKSRVAPEIAGTLCSILTRGRIVRSGTIVLALAEYGDGFSKVSIRSRDVSFDLLRIISEASQGLDIEFGGHSSAAGAIVRTSQEDAFIDSVYAVLSNYIFLKNDQNVN